VIFHKEEYARKFNLDLQRCPEERDRRENFPSSFQDLETELKEARDVINCYHNQIEQLEEEVRAMEQKVSDLQQQHRMEQLESDRYSSRGGIELFASN